MRKTFLRGENRKTSRQHNYKLYVSSFAKMLMPLTLLYFYHLNLSFYLTIVNLKYSTRKPSCDCKGQNQSKCWYTCQGISSALKSQTLPNLMCSKNIYRSKWVDRFWLVKALSCIVEGGQNDSQKQSNNAPACTVGSTVKDSQLTDFDHDLLATTCETCDLVSTGVSHTHVTHSSLVHAWRECKSKGSNCDVDNESALF